jgi:hypothetical protein
MYESTEDIIRRHLSMPGKWSSTGEWFHHLVTDVKLFEDVNKRLYIHDLLNPERKEYLVPEQIPLELVHNR